MDFFNCISLSEAQNIMESKLFQNITGSEEVSLVDALGSITAVDIAAAEDLPPFSRSTVDGYAVLSRDTFGAGEGVPVMLAISGEVFMGQAATGAVNTGQAVIIPTGGMLPAGTDAVVMLEHTERSDSETLMVLRPVAPGENVVAKGEDIKAGSVFVESGTKITSAEIGALAACGITKVKVRTRLTVGIISTGDEVVDIDAKLVGGQVRDINSYSLAAMLDEAGCAVKRYGIVKDKYEDLLAALRVATNESQLVLVSGGSSVGARDHTVKVIEELGQREVMFHGLAIKPGKPTIFGMVGQVPVFGLPGHPVAAITICKQLVMPVVHRLQGLSTSGGWNVKARFTRNMASAPGRDDFFRVKLSWQDGEYRADPVLGKSGLISTMTQANGVVQVPASSSGLYAGDMVVVKVVREA